MTIDDFLDGIDYKSKFVGKDLCGVIMVEFDNENNMFPSIEFGTIENNGQYFYFEIVNLGEEDGKIYKDGDFINLSSNRRKCVLNTRLTEDSIKTIQNHVNKSLKELYDNNSNG